MRRFGTEGRLYLEDNYVVRRTEETADFIDRVKQGKYIVLFAPRQTGKTTFFRLALEALTSEDLTYFPIQLNFEESENDTRADFYRGLSEDIREEIETVFQGRGESASGALLKFVEETEIIDHREMRRCFAQLARLLELHYGIKQKVVLLIDEFDAIPRDAVTGFLRSLRQIFPAKRDVRIASALLESRTSFNSTMIDQSRRSIFRMNSIYLTLLLNRCVNCLDSIPKK